MKKRLFAVALAGMLTLAGCGGGDPLESGGSEESGIVVGSADFPENVLLAEIYAGALRGAGQEVTVKSRVGAREALVKGLQDGSLTVIPEYTGNLLAYLDKNASATKPAQVNSALKKALPDDLEVLKDSKAEDSDVLVVAKQTADKHKLKTVEDLSKVAGQLTMGGAGEWKTRWTGPIKKLYGIEFKKFQPTDAGGPVTVQALEDGKVDVANLFTTSSAIKKKGFVQLEDTKQMYPAQNVVPLARKDKLDDKGKSALDEVAGALDTKTLTDLVYRVEVDKENAADVAEDFLGKEGIQKG